MENATSDVSAPNKTPSQLEQDMFETRESITEKVAALENQVIGTIQTAADTVTEAVGTVTDAVGTVKDAVSAAPAAVNDTLKETVQAVKQTLRDTVGSFSVSQCVRNHAALALGTTVLGGFVIGYGFSAGRTRKSGSSRQLLSPDARELLERPAPTPRPSPPTLLDGWMQSIARELRSMGEEFMATAVRSIKQNINSQVPAVVESAVHQMTDPIRMAAARARTSHAMSNGH